MFGTVGDFTVPVGILLRFGGKRMVVLLEYCLGVPFHGEAAGLLLLVPVKVDTGVLLSFPISGDGVVLFRSREELCDVVFLQILNT